MVFGLFNFKRKFFSVEESNEFTNGGGENDSPTKKVRVEGQLVNDVPDTNSCSEEEEEEEVCFEVLPRNAKGKEKERIEELEEEVRETREITARLMQETREYVGSIDRTMNCVVCFDLIQNPQVMSECGHTACYLCLRSWFTRATVRRNTAPMISTDEESDGNALDEPQPESNNPTPPTTKGRHRFRSVVNRRKTCPECQVVVTHRPAPLYRLRHVADAMSGSECPVPSFLQRRRKPHQLSKRKDLWHGIFHEHNVPTKTGKYHLVVENPGPVVDEGPDPILEHWAQAQVRRDAQLENEQWQAAIDEAREEGKRQVIWEQRRERERLEEQRRRHSFNPANFHFWDAPLREEDARRRIFPPFRFRNVAGNLIAPQKEDIVPISSAPVPVPQPTLLPALPPSPRMPPPDQLPEFMQGLSAIFQLPTRPVFLGPPPSEAGPSRSSQATTTSTTTPASQQSSLPSAPAEDPMSSGSHPPTDDSTILRAIREIRQQYNNNPRSSSQEKEEDADALEDEGTDLSLFQAMFRNPTPPPQPPAEEERLYPIYAEDLDLQDIPRPDPQPQVDLPAIFFENGPIFPRHQEEEEEDEDPVERLERLVREGEAAADN